LRDLDFGKLVFPPLSRPPGRADLLGRFAPEIFACMAYGFTGLVFLIWRDDATVDQLLQQAAMVAYAVIGLGLVMVPVNAAAASLAGEKTRMTIEGLVLTPGRHWKLALGRYAFVLWPGIRLLLYLIPVYFVLASGALFREALDSGEWWAPPTCVLLPKPVLAIACAAVAAFERGELAFRPGGALMIAGRILNDFSVLLLVSGVAFYVSARARSAARALILGYLLVLLLILVVMPLGVWFIVIAAILENMAGWRSNIDEDTIFGGYVAIASVTALVRLALGLALPAAVACRFDRYVIGEK
jgi:hypothetical protein